MAGINLHQDPHANGEATGDEFQDGAALESLFADGETADDFVKRINGEAGTTYETVDAIANALKESGKLAAELGRIKKEKQGEGNGEGEGQGQQPPAKQPVQQTTTQSDEVTELFFEGNEDARLVRDDLERVAKSQGRTARSVWNDTNETWLKEKSSHLRKTAEAKDRVGDPSSQTTGKTLTEEQKTAKRLAGNMPTGFSTEKPNM